jgi:hypothetical protein
MRRQSIIWREKLGLLQARGKSVEHVLEAWVLPAGWVIAIVDKGGQTSYIANGMAAV